MLLPLLTALALISAPEEPPVEPAKPAETKEEWTEKVVVTDGNLANAFVYVKDGVTGDYPAPSEKGLLDQVGCRYTPHVSGLQVGQTIVIRSDINAKSDLTSG